MGPDTEIFKFKGSCMKSAAVFVEDFITENGGFYFFLL